MTKTNKDNKTNHGAARKAINSTLLVLALVLSVPVLLMESRSFQTRLAGRILDKVSESIPAHFHIDSLAISPSRMCVEVYGLSATDSLSCPILNVRRIDGSIRLLRFLLHKEVAVNNIHVTGFDLHLVKDSLDAPLNISPLFSSQKQEYNNSPKPVKIDLRSLMILDGHVSYDVLSEPHIETTDPCHLSVNVNTQMALKLAVTPRTGTSDETIANDIQADIKLNKFSLEEQNGFKIDRIRFHASMNNDSIFVKGMNIEMPGSRINLNSFSFIGPLDKGILTNTATLRAELSPSDFPTVRQLYKQAEMPLSPLQLLFSVNGSVQNANASVSLHAGNLFFIDGWCRATKILSDDFKVISQWKQLEVNTELTKLVCRIIPDLKLPPIVDSIGFARYSGELLLTDNNPYLNGTLSTAVGDIAMKAHLQHIDSLQKLTAEISTTGLGVERLGLDFLTGPATLQASVDGILPHKGVPMQANGSVHIDNVSLLSYEYEDLDVSASVNGKLYKANFKAQDPNLRCSLNASYDKRSTKPEIAVRMEVPHANLHQLHLLDSDDENSDLSFNVNGNVKGSDIKEMISAIHLEISDFSLLNNASKYEMNRLTVVSGKLGTNNYLQISSPLINGRILGTGTCIDFAEDVRDGIINRYLPSLFIGREWKPSDDLYQFSLRIRGTQSLVKALGLPVSIENLAVLDGSYNNGTGIFNLSLESSDVSMDRQRLVMPVLRIDNHDESSGIKMHAESGLLKDGNLSDMSVDMTVMDDSIDMSASWGDFSISEKGYIDVSVRLDRDQKGDPMCMRISMESPSILVADEDWTIDPSEIRILTDGFYVNSLSLHSGDKYLRANGAISKEVTDTLTFDVNGVRLDDIFALLPSSEQDPFTLGGTVTAKGRAVSLIGAPQIEGMVSVKSFAVKKRILGDLSAHSWWNEQDKCIQLEGVFAEDSLEICQVNGSFAPATSVISLDAKSNGLPIDFVGTFLEPTLTLNGRVYGDVGVDIGLKSTQTEILLNGSPRFNGKIGVTPIGSKFFIDDIVGLQPQQISFDNVRLSDRENHTGMVNGNIKHHSFQDIRFDLDIDMNSLLAMDIPASETETMYGNVLASGKVAITGTDKDIQINVNAHTDNPSNFTFSLGSVSVSDYEFITFTDHTIKASVAEQTNIATPKTAQGGSLKLNLQLEVTDDTEVNLKLGQGIGDGLKGRGNGKIRIEFDPASDVGIFGDYELHNGLFQFKFKNIIQRNFSIQQGSKIRFSGDPLKAQMGVTASYHVVGASLSGLLSESDINSLNLTRQTIPVDCKLALSGELQQPQINMDLEFPNADPEVKRRIFSVINNEEVLSRQLVYLLLLNSFAPTDNSQVGNTATSNMNTVWGATISGLTSQLNQVLFDALGTDKFSFGFNYNSDLNTGSNEWQVALTGNLLDNRLKINGNVGQRDNQVTNVTNQFIGDFDIEYKLTQRLRLKAYSHSNDSRYFKSATTTQGLGIVVKDSFNSLSQLWGNWVESFNRQKVRSFSYSDLLPKAPTNKTGQ